MKSKISCLFNNKGQGLVEYALIMVLVALVLVVVLALLGPSIGKTYSNVVNGLGPVSSAAHPTAVPTTPPTAVPTLAPSPTPDWAFCSDEYQECVFSGTREVRYGANGHYVILTLTNGTHCGNSVFGDPLVGVLKHCYIR